MTQVSDIAPELRKLVLLLGSNHAGEVAAAAAQVTRKLKAAALDWHNLADALENAAPADLHQRPSGYATCWQDAVDHLIFHTDLRGRDREFVVSMNDIIGRGYTPTEKQARWLRGLFQRTGGSLAEEAA